MNLSNKFAVLVLTLGLVFISAGMLAVTGARAYQEGPASGKITLLRSDRPVYVPRTTAIFNVEVENDGAATQDYQLTMVAYGPSGDEVFRSKVERINLLPAGERVLIQFQWGTSGRTEAGAYTLTADLRDLVQFDVLFDSITREDGRKFEVQSKPLIFMSDDELDFGDFMPGETPEKNIFISNTGNSVLEWRVVRVPDDWIELVGPLGDAKESATITIRVKPEAPITRRLLGELVIESNGGDRVIPLSGKILGDFSGDLDSLRSRKGLYRQGETLALEYTVENDGTVSLEYSAAVVLIGPDGSVAYDAMLAGENVRLSIRADAFQTVNFVWDIPLDAPVGFYEAYVTLTYWFDNDYVFYDALDSNFLKASSKPAISQLFEVKLGPRLVVDPLEWDYGTVLVGQSIGSANLEVSNAGGATLEWELVSWPDWIEIAKPSTPKNAGGSNILARVRPSLPPDDYRGTIRLESNGGNVSIPISLSLTLPATPTSVPIATVEPTATSAPTSTPPPPSPTATERPVRAAPPPPTSTPLRPTSTPVPPTATPAPTATPVILVQVTVEPTPDSGQSGVGCSVPLANVSLGTGLVNGLLMLAPLGLVLGARYRRRKGK